jgi:large subunit ribosomal protein L9
MKVILLNNIKKIGSRFEVVDVAPGFGMNFLIPQKKALPATPENLANIEGIKAGQADAIAQERQETSSALNALEGKEVTLKLAANEQGGLYESVTAEDIAAGLKDQHGIDLDAVYINLETPIKEVGEYQIACAYEDTSAVCSLIIAASEDEE